MIHFKKKRLIIEFEAGEPEKFLTSLRASLTGSARRMLNSDDVFNDPETITDIDNLMRLNAELNVSEEQLKMILKQGKKKGKG